MPGLFKVLSLLVLAFASLVADAATITKNHFEGGKNLTQGSKQGSAGTLSELVMALQDGATAVDAAVIKKNGSVAFTAAQSMGGFKLTSLGTPTAVGDAATKAYVDGKILAFACTASSGGGATEALTCTGLLSTDTVLSVVQNTPGANSLALLGWSTVINDGVTGIWAADPGAGAVALVSVKR